MLDTKLTTLAFQPDVKALLMGGADGRVYRWKFLAEAGAESIEEREKAFERYIGHGSVVSALVFHPHGRVFFSGDWQGVFSAWTPFDIDPFKGEYDENIFGGNFFSEKSSRRIAQRLAQDGIDHLIISDDGQYVVLADAGGKLELWQVRGLKKVAEILSHKGAIYDVSFFPRSHRLVSAGRDGKVVIWEIKQEDMPIKTTQSFERVKELVISGVRKLEFVDEKQILAGTVDGRIIEVKIDV